MKTDKLIQEHARFMANHFIEALKLHTSYENEIYEALLYFAEWIKDSTNEPK